MSAEVSDPRPARRRRRPPRQQPRPEPEVVVTVGFRPVPWTAEREAARRAAMEAVARVSGHSD